MDERIYQIALSLLTGIGPIKAKTLVSYAGSLENVFQFSEQDFQKINGISANSIKKLNRSNALLKAENELNFIEKNGISLYYYQDNNYPSQLKFQEDCPIVLFTKGNISFDKRNLAVVGTRNASDYGKKITEQFVADLAKTDIQIISGLAHGIDKKAHSAALKNGLSTFAVLGHGLNFIYPAANKYLAEKMLENGGLVTEFLSHTSGDPSNFPRRNRIVAGLADATIVIESKAAGGSLITAQHAFDYDRDVFAFPGNSERLLSVGCNNLIRSGKAKLITSAQDVLSDMNWDIESDLSVFQQATIFDSLTTNEVALVNVIKTQIKPAHIDLISEKIGLSSNEISLHLFNLEMRGVIKMLGGQSYAMVN